MGFNRTRNGNVDRQKIVEIQDVIRPSDTTSEIKIILNICTKKDTNVYMAKSNKSTKTFYAKQGSPADIEITRIWGRLGHNKNSIKAAVAKVFPVSPGRRLIERLLREEKRIEASIKEFESVKSTSPNEMVSTDAKQQ